jgi:putative Mg2+ transporter-C (MgtC) family protein
LIARVAIGFGLAFLLGFERELRGSQAGDRTFALVGASVTAVTATLWRQAPQAIAGALTGIGFIGAGVVLRGQNDLVRGITTAAAIFATAAIGIVVGTGHIGLGIASTLGMLFTLELRNIPVVNRIDARRYQSAFRNDNDPPMINEPKHPKQ